MRPEIAAKNTNYVNYANSNAASLALVSDEVKNDRGICPSAETKTKLVPDLAESPQFTRQLTRTWTRFKTGK
jgi:putrescine transport system substrate-binding protein